MRNLKLIASVSIPLSPIAELFEKYVFGDWEFVKFLIVLICLDTVLGFIKHWLTHDINSKAFAMIAKKLIVYSAVMILGHVLSSFSVGGEPVESFVWFRYFACSALMVREAISIIENGEEILPGFFPVSVISRLKGFDNETGKKKPDIMSQSCNEKREDTM